MREVRERQRNKKRERKKKKLLKGRQRRRGHREGILRVLLMRIISRRSLKKVYEGVHGGGHPQKRGDTLVGSQHS
ncbi:hypothetical protein CN457_27785 [Bacillus cereus]|nr:hypothetical protein CN457_27785 [Bacillus cereus]